MRNKVRLLKAASLKIQKGACIPRKPRRYKRKSREKHLTILTYRLKRAKCGLL